jgi:hypothetical protein
MPVFKICFIFLFFVMGLTNCHQENRKPESTNTWKTLDFKAFTLKVPQEWQIITKEGIDSYWGGLTNQNDTLYFDLGQYSASVGNENNKIHKFTVDTINGKKARIVIPNEDGKGIIAMSIRQLKNKENKFILWGNNVDNTELILKIFKSLTFPESDTSINTKLTITKFNTLNIGTGKSLFNTYCSSCHAKNVDLTGPALKNIIENKSIESVHQFLTVRNSLQDKQRQEALRKRGDVQCTLFPQLKKEEVELIIDYLGSAENFSQRFYEGTWRVGIVQKLNE